MTLQDLRAKREKGKLGYNKLLFCRNQTRKDGLKYFWIDTCCIDQSSSREVEEAINSMFRWYRESAKCYVFLTDIPRPQSTPADLTSWSSMVRAIRWFTRGWTLQELLAPKTVDFFDRTGKPLGNKHSLQPIITDITGIPEEAITGAVPLDRFDVLQRFSWARRRVTKRPEDIAYCLLGIFDVTMNMRYGEGQLRALRRLHRKVMKSKQEGMAGEERRQLMRSVHHFAISGPIFSERTPAPISIALWCLKEPTALSATTARRPSEHLETELSPPKSCKPITRPSARSRYDGKRPNQLEEAEDAGATSTSRKDGRSTVEPVSAQQSSISAASVAPHEPPYRSYQPVFEDSWIRSNRRHVLRAQLAGPTSKASTYDDNAKRLPSRFKD